MCIKYSVAVVDVDVAVDVVAVVDVVVVIQATVPLLCRGLSQMVSVCCGIRVKRNDKTHHAAHTPRMSPKLRE